ncbi:HYR domain-containing protein, partial [Christiangramia aquimixticola]|uniref:HYR domain-containing protein n=1 Tax=Christiangramia aquimixticola TaxID=1697558 RepID=UPI003AA91C90
MTDILGGTATIDFDIIVQDNEDPIAVSKPVVAVLDSNGNATILPENSDNGSTDNCGIREFELSQTSFSKNDLGTISVIFTVWDINDNFETINATVSVIDTEKPKARAKDIPVELNSSGTVTIAAQDVDDGSTDNVAITSYSIDKNTFTCSDIGENTVTLTVSDASGNTDTATAIVTVEDKIDPTISCISSTSRNTDPGSCDYTVQGAEFDPSFEDNCSGATITNNYNNSSTLAGAVIPEGDPITIKWTVTDTSGNEDSCSFNVTVIDDEAPVITNCPTPVNSYSVDAGECDAALSFNATATDNCDDNVAISYSVGGSNISFPYNFPIGTTTVTVTADDGDS